MDFANSSELIKLFVVINSLFYVVKIWRDSKKAYPPISYSNYSQPNTESWRWRKPDDELCLIIEDHEDSSHVVLNGEMLFFEKIIVGVGYLLGVLMIWIVIMFFVKGQADIWALFIVIIPMALSLSMLHIGKFINRIVLRENCVEFITSYGFFFQSKNICRRKQRLKFKGSKEGLLELTRDHKHPRFKLFVKPGLVFSKLYLLPVPPSQGHWIFEGLKVWKG